MKRAFLAVVIACVVSVSVAASAQNVGGVMPGPNMPVVFPTNAPAGGITTAGHATERVAADRFRLSVRFFGAPPLPAGAPPTQASVDDLEKTVVAAMRANGIADARFVTPVTGPIASNDAVVGSISKPTREKVADIEQRVVAALPPSVAMQLRNVNVMGSLETDDCSDAARRAARGAYEDARVRADVLAAAAGVHLGGLLAASESDVANGCRQNGARGFQFFANDDLDVDHLEVSASVTATFAIRP